MTTTTAIMPCPICRTELRMAERQGIEIDTCPTCRGVWLDRGELDKIIERSAADMAPSQPQPGFGHAAPWPTRHRDYEDDDDHRRYGYKKRKRSFLSDLFD